YLFLGIDALFGIARLREEASCASQRFNGPTRRLSTSLATRSFQKKSRRLLRPGQCGAGDGDIVKQDARASTCWDGRTPGDISSLCSLSADSGRARCVTAREMDARERRLYHRERR